jgi:hypothetical protein
MRERKRCGPRRNLGFYALRSKNFGLDSRPMRVLNARDALEALLEEAEYEEVLLREYVMCVGYH